MKRFLAARAALMALAALGMISASPTFAAGLDLGTVDFQAKKGNVITDQPDPGYPGTIYQAGPADLTVDYKGRTGSNGS